VIFQNYLSNVTDRWPLFMGLIFVLMVLYVPGGLSGVIMNIKQRFFGKKNNNGDKTAQAEEVIS
jgi:branched-chain amino acid transport system permease protein